MPFLVAAPADTPLLLPSPTAPCAAFIDDAAPLRMTPSSHLAISMGAPELGVSPPLIASLIKRLCGEGDAAGVVLAPFDRYGVIAAGAALAGRDFAGLCPTSPEDGSGHFERSCLYVRGVLREAGVAARMDGDALADGCFNSNNSDSFGSPAAQQQQQQQREATTQTPTFRLPTSTYPVRDAAPAFMRG
jgi:hypothetical protein